MKITRTFALSAAALMALPLAACGGSSSGGSSSSAAPASSSAAPASSSAAPASSSAEAPSGDPIILGADIPLTGGLSVFAPVIQGGYQNAIDDINAAGGVDVGGTMRPLQLVVKDNKSDPNEVTASTKALINEDGAVALLGSVTPPLTIPFSNVADQEGIPAISSLTPTLAWLGANPGGWKYSYDMFIDEIQQTELNFKTSDLTETNKKVALFTDTEEDGEAMGALWEKAAPANGYEIAYRAKFPVGTTDFSQFIREAQAKGAEIVIAQVIPPDGVALWKQMKALQYQPKVAFAEKAGTFGWDQALGPIADGTSVFLWWSPKSGTPGSEKIVADWMPKVGDGAGLDGVVSCYSLVQVLADAIHRAGSTDPDAINEALAATKDLSTVQGTLTVGADHRIVIPATMGQWQGKSQPVVYPTEEATAKLIAPVAGLAK